MITQDRLKTVLYYSHETGLFTWKYRPRKLFASQRAYNIFNATYPGRKAGSLRPDGYYEIRIDRKLYRAHKLAYLYTRGYLPELEVDHINGVRGDNRLTNLREVTSSENKRNSSIRNDNSSGVVGVSWYKASSKWSAQIRVPNCYKNEFLGYFEDKFQAICARKSAENRLSYHANHGKRSNGY